MGLLHRDRVIAHVPAIAGPHDCEDWPAVRVAAIEAATLFEPVPVPEPEPEPEVTPNWWLLGGIFGGGIIVIILLIVIYVTHRRD